MERYPLGSTIGLKIRSTFFQYLHLWPISFNGWYTHCKPGDNTPPYVSDNKTSTAVISLERSANLMFDWLTDSQRKGNDDKCHVLLSTDEILQVKIGAALIKSIESEELLGNIYIYIYI